MGFRFVNIYMLRVLEGFVYRYFGFEFIGSRAVIFGRVLVWGVLCGFKFRV